MKAILIIYVLKVWMSFILLWFQQYNVNCHISGSALFCKLIEIWKYVCCVRNGNILKYVLLMKYICIVIEIFCLCVYVPGGSDWWQYRVCSSHDEVMKWKCFPHYWFFMRGIHQWLVDSLRKGPGMQTFDVYLMSAWTNSLTNTNCSVPGYGLVPCGR